VRIQVASTNDSPTNISLSSTSITENNAINEVIGILSTTDPDIGNNFIYSLINGVGSADNGSFNIDENKLRTSVIFNFENKSFYSIRIRATDQNNSFIEKVFVITINDIDEIGPTAPSNLNGSSITSDSFIVSWVSSIDNNSVESYEIYLNDILIETITSISTSYNFLGLDPDTSYNVKIRAIDNDDNFSPYSDLLIIRTNP
jgi:hypothetical protein